MMDRSIAEGTAHGRLDVMGGISDYSGGLVLQMPIREQISVQMQLRDDDICRVNTQLNNTQVALAVNYRDFVASEGIDYAYARRSFKLLGRDRWLSYVIGCALVLEKEFDINFRGADITITSNVPVGKGVSSSAALEIATMRALALLYHIEFEGTQLAILAQRVENEIAGAPCGLMDQLASAFGLQEHLLPIQCQPDLMRAPVRVPENLLFAGLDSGIRHAVEGDAYSHVRCAAFMGYSMIAHALGVTAQELEQAVETADFSKLPYEGYLSNISVAEFESSFRQLLPGTMTGWDFLNLSIPSIDRVTAVNPEMTYCVAASTAHPVYENARVSQFLGHLLELNNTDDHMTPGRLAQMGGLMKESHTSYSACGLGSPRTDEIVERCAGQPGIYGARITGGGSGGTVCIMADRDIGSGAILQIRDSMMSKYDTSLSLFM